MGNAKTLIKGSKAKQGKIVEIDLEGGKLRVELRPPSIGKKTQLFEEVGLEDAGEGRGKVKNPAKFTALLLIHCAYDADTRERLWTTDELADVMDLDREFDPLVEAALSLVRPPEDAAGKSVPTPSSI